VRCIAVGAIAIVACVSAAGARQSSTSDSAEKKPAATKTTTHKHHKTKAPAAKTSGTASTSASAKSTSKTHAASAGKGSSHKKSTHARGQQKIDSERAQSIQEALIREHYLSGEATGTWNQSSEEAMRRFQADQGWQTKQVPDSRALIKLGLGPSKDHLLNPESAMTTVPDSPRAQTLPTTSHSASPTSGPASTPASNQTNSPIPQ
jgi:sulfite reductase alpha subunit-like flavoprotein